MYRALVAARGAGAGPSDWRLVERCEPIFRVGDDFAQNHFHPWVFREPQRDPEPNDPRP
jgi:hypothetical protein